MERDKKQVEEEQRELFEIVSKYSPEREPLTFDDIHEIVRHIDDAGYRKVLDGVVVLTKEELENLGKYVDITEDVKKEFQSELKQVRKETAMEILDKIANRYGGAWLVELYKEYVNDVEE